jgi:hypothetical protein
MVKQPFCVPDDNLGIGAQIMARAARDESK